MKFGVLVVLTFVLAATFVSAADRPVRTPTEQEVAALQALAAPAPAPIIPQAAQAVADLGGSFKAVADLVRPAVVYIRADVIETTRQQVPRGFEDLFPDSRGGQRLRRGQGSGFIISPDGYIITNNHVVENASKLIVRLYDKREFEARVVGRDPSTDVAVIKIDESGLPAVSLGDSDSLSVGEWVLAVGNPMGEQFSFTVTAGIVSAKGRVLNGLPIQSAYRILDFIQTDAVINPGNSGGPLVNIRGQVMGVNSAIASDNGFYQGYGFAIPANLVRAVSSQLIADGRVTRAILGIAINPVTPEDAEFVGLDEIRGVRVDDFSMPNSPAEAAGIVPGDIIVELDGERVDYVGQLQQLVGFRRPGETVKVTVVRRGGEHVDIPVLLSEAPSEETTVASAAPVEDPTPGDHETKLGIAVRPLDEETAGRRESIGTQNAGLAVMSVDLDSPARERLIPTQRGRLGDIITHVNGVRVRTIADLDTALGETRAGDLVSLRVFNPSGNQGNGISRVVRLRVSR